jgi:ATP-dependent DNA helicase RecQ
MPTTDLQAGAEGALRDLAGPGARFRPGQLEAIGDLVGAGARVLCVQRTGWGKSAVYFVATKLLRERGAGPTLIVSPLLALMRNQLAAASRLGLRAHTVNSTNQAEWDAIASLLDADEVDLLLISPERLNNPGFRARMLDRVAERIGLLVIDEAHCISDWGHDFRPDYRRIRDLLARLGDVAVLCTTATANDRVVADVAEQLGTGARGAIRSYRGSLARDSLRLEVVGLARPAERLAWLSAVVPRLEGSGIVYCLTRRDCDRVAGWLNAHGVSARAYAGDQETERREDSEGLLLRNEVKALVATSALGMGYDKGDLGWIVHYQAPGSVIAYYQQVGRAGRAVDHADVVLLRGAEDRSIQDFFIAQAFPPREAVDQVLGLLGQAGADGLSLTALLADVNLGRTRLEGMLKVLDVEGAVQRSGSRWALAPGASAWTYDAERYRQVTALRRAEQEAMARYGSDGRCLMGFLQEQLDDPEPAERCGRCAVCAGPRWADPSLVDPAVVAEAQRHLRGAAVELGVKRQWPATADRRQQRIPEELRLWGARALARPGDGGWDELLRTALDGGAAGEELLGGVLAALGAFAPAWVTWVPSRAARREALLRELAGAVAGRLGVPAAEVVRRAADRPPMRELRNAAAQFDNLRGAFAVGDPVPGGPVLLLDDESASGWTLAMVGGQLRHRGAGDVLGFSLLHRGA